jgi:hypothetical protein
MSKITTRSQDRPKDAGIAQTGLGIPEDSGAAADVSNKGMEQARRKLQDDGGPTESIKRERDKERSPANGEHHQK